MSKKDLLLLFDRPREPLFVTKKGHKTKAFDVPDEYLVERYKQLGPSITSRFGEEAEERVPLKRISIPPLGEILDLERDTNFSVFIPKHRRISGKLIELFLQMKTVEDLLSLAAYVRDRANPYMFNYALSVAILHRPDTNDLILPSFAGIFPDKFIDPKVFARAVEEAATIPEGLRGPIEIPMNYTASDLEKEHCLAYFREDIGINLHHWHWHLVYPTEGPMEVVFKDRRGELFIYMHQQVVARYNFERLCNKLKRVVPFKEYREPIEEAYFPKLDSLVASRVWPYRASNMALRDVNREGDEIHIDVEDLIKVNERILEAIDSGRVIDEEGNPKPLTELDGVEILGNAMESNILSVNRALYKDLHAEGHVLISYIHDPDQRHLEPAGVMGDPATAMRDPVFYRWHGHIDDIANKFKERLPSYSADQLNFSGIVVSKVELQSQGSSTNNTLSTFWQESDVDFSRGVDFQPGGPIFVRFTHLTHAPFTYKITVNNKTDGNRKGTCRIFMAPRFDEKGNRWLLAAQRRLFIELDRFTVNLKQGENTLHRASVQSSVTIPYETTFRSVDLNRPEEADALLEFNFCGCGWPQHMLIPKGTPEGMPCQLFVMISNYENDQIEQEVTGVCNDGDSYCGIKDRLYPDRRAMGYPFDRLPRDGADILQQFLTPNMRIQDVVIKFSNRTIKPKQQNKI